MTLAEIIFIVFLATNVCQFFWVCLLRGNVLNYIKLTTSTWKFKNYAWKNEILKHWQSFCLKPIGSQYSLFFCFVFPQYVLNILSTVMEISLSVSGGLFSSSSLLCCPSCPKLSCVLGDLPGWTLPSFLSLFFLLSFVSPSLPPSFLVFSFHLSKRVKYEGIIALDYFFPLIWPCLILCLSYHPPTMSYVVFCSLDKCGLELKGLMSRALF